MTTGFSHERAAGFFISVRSVASLCMKSMRVHASPVSNLSSSPSPVTDFNAGHVAGHIKRALEWHKECVIADQHDERKIPVPALPRHEHLRVTSATVAKAIWLPKSDGTKETVPKTTSKGADDESAVPKVPTTM